MGLNATAMGEGLLTEPFSPRSGDLRRSNVWLLC